MAASDSVARYLGLRSNRSCPCRMGRVPMVSLSTQVGSRLARPRCQWRNIPKLLVEPFQDATGTAEGATIAIGLTEEVVEKLARCKDLVVVLSDPRTPDPLASSAETNSAMRYALAGSVRVARPDHGERF